MVVPEAFNLPGCRRMAASKAEIEARYPVEVSHGFDLRYSPFLSRLEGIQESGRRVELQHSARLAVTLHLDRKNMPFGVAASGDIATNETIRTRLLTPVRGIYGEHVLGYEHFNVVNVVAITLRYRE